MTTQIRTRFAPSPTGNLHIGGARTALYSYLWAKKNQGAFLLRIEDTDQTRYQPEAEQSILNGLQWLGLQWDEPIIKQSTRTQLYQEYAQKLITNNKAYYCFCTSERLETMRQLQRKKNRAPRYDKHCLTLSDTEINTKMAAQTPYVIRLNIPEEGSVVIEDLVRGRIEFQCSELDDQILLKSDGFPTYHLANIVDDHESNITHVIRGEEWIPSTPKHVLLYQAFGWEPPQFAHLSLFINKGGGKLSKREGATSLLEYKKQGYLAEAVNNFIAMLGWNPKTNQELFTLPELIAAFDLHTINTANPIFDTEKLDWYNAQYIRKLPLTRIVEYCKPYLPQNQPADYLEKIVSLEQDRIKTFAEITEYTDFFFKETLDYDTALLNWKKNTLQQTAEYLKQVREQLNNVTDWTQAHLESVILPWIKENNYGNGDILWPLRVALTGKKASPSPFEVAAVLGKDKSLQRIELALQMIAQMIAV